MNTLEMDQDWVTFQPLHADVAPPTRGTAGSAGYDLRAFLLGRTVTCRKPNNDIFTQDGNGGVLLEPLDRAMIPLGFKARLPVGYEAQIRPRSGQAFKVGLGIVNSPGTVDADFPDEWQILVINLSSVPLVIAHGERIAQMVLHRFELFDFAHGVVGATTERAGGFGSTGV